jgi:2'-5' RNA ligase
MNDRELLTAFEAGSVKPETFGHRAHVRVAWAYLQELSAVEALAKVSEGLKRLTRAFGKESMYHETVTVAYVLLINERIERAGRGGSWEEFEAQNSDLFDRDRPLLERYYKPETLRSDLARRIFVFPDRIGGGEGITR